MDEGVRDERFRKDFPKKWTILNIIFVQNEKTSPKNENKIGWGDWVGDVTLLKKINQNIDHFLIFFCSSKWTEIGKAWHKIDHYIYIIYIYICTVY